MNQANDVNAKDPFHSDTFPLKTLGESAERNRMNDEGRWLDPSVDQETFTGVGFVDRGVFLIGHDWTEANQSDDSTDNSVTPSKIPSLSISSYSLFLFSFYFVLVEGNTQRDEESIDVRAKVFAFCLITK